MVIQVSYVAVNYGRRVLNGGTTAGIANRRTGRHRSRTARGDDPRRPRRRRGARRTPGRDRRSAEGQSRGHESQPARGGGQPEDRRGPRTGAGADRQGRRADRGLPARCHRAAGPRPRGLRQGQRAAGVRADDRMGPDRPAQPAGRPRHQLHLPQRPAALHRPRRRTPGPAAQPDRRLRRRLDVPDRRHPRGAVGTADAPARARWSTPR